MMKTYREGFFRHPEDCTKFYRCVDRSRTLRSFQIFFFRDGLSRHMSCHAKNKFTNLSTFSHLVEASSFVVFVEKFCDLFTF